MRTILILAMVISFAPLGVARAEDIAAARQHFERGATLYDLQRYVEAAVEYERAYEAKADPVFLYDIAQAYRLGGEPKKALGAYRGFRRHSPAEAARLGVDARIAELEATLKAGAAVKPQPPAPVEPVEPPHPAALPATAAPPPAPTVPPPPAPVVAMGTEKPRASSTGRTKTIAGAVVTGVGGALLVTGVALTVVGHAAYDQLQNPPAGYTFDPATQDAMKIDFPTGLALVGVGAAAVVAGSVVLALGARERRRAVAVAPAVAPHFAGAALQVHF